MAESGLITSHLKWVELATLLLVALAIGLLFRAPGAAALTVGAVAVAFVVAEHLVAELGRLSGTAVPTDVQPVLVVLVVGVVTDYSIFFLSAFRGLLAQGQGRREAAVQVMRQIAPIVFMAGLTVAAGTIGLLAANLNYLRAFGPGLAVAVVIAMLVAVTLIPAVLGLCGANLFWPRRPGAAPPKARLSPPPRGRGDSTPVTARRPATRSSAPAWRSRSCSAVPVAYCTSAWATSWSRDSPRAHRPAARTTKRIAASPPERSHRRW